MPRFLLENVKGRFYKNLDDFRLRLYITKEDDIKGLSALSKDVIQIAKADRAFNLLKLDYLKIVRKNDLKDVNYPKYIILKIDKWSIIKSSNGNNISLDILIKKLSITCDVIIQPRYIIDGFILVTYLDTCYVDTTENINI